MFVTAVAFCTGIALPALIRGEISGAVSDLTVSPGSSISFKLERFPTEHNWTKRSLDSQLRIDAIYFIKILTSLVIIVKKFETLDYIG